MRVGELLKSKSFGVLMSFMLVAAIASLISSPWRDGPLLELRPETPPGFRAHQPLIIWPEATEDAALPVPVNFDLLMDVSTEDVAAITQASDTAATPRAPTDSEASPTKPPSAGEGASPQDKPAPGSPASTRETRPGAVQPSSDYLPGFHGPFRVGEGPLAAPASADPRDLALLASLREVREQLPHRSNHLEIPCRHAREYEDGRPMLRTQEARSNGGCSAKALDNFYASLRDRAFRKDGLTRWTQYGDSLVVGDTLTGELRRLFQRQFGDGGHGFLYIGQPLRAFGVENMRVSTTDAWNVRTIVRHSPTAGDLFGVGGAEFRATSNSELSTQGAKDGDIGRELERFHVFYFAPPGVSTGQLRVIVDGESRLERFATTPGSSGVHTIQIPRGEHRVVFRDFSQQLRYYGVVSETSGPGVVIDNVGQVSAREEHLLKINPEHWRDQLALLDPDLVAFFYGVNSASSVGSRIEERDTYADNYREVIRRATAGAPDRDCLVLSLLTRGTREGGRISPTSAVAVLNREQRNAALSSGCAFFDTTGLMGGPNGTRRWAEGRPALLGADLAHPTRAGYREIARRLYADIIDGFIDYMERRVAQEGSP